ncbi:hypothetical protein AAV99_11875 [Aurantiacibacter marinus]|uniref:Uncharacterized protein n=1 Tax=Aurantiacibacter marinus TaxID=874156 RepID=A0A0H0XMX6_9SPHN|nr:hypothetical protein AAV99_11875 [Aurantiacibacter marinus]
MFGGYLAGQRNSSEMAYVQHYRLVDIPLARGPHFAISTPADAVLQGSLDDAVDETLADNEVGADAGSGGQSGASVANDDAFVFVAGRRLLNVDYDLGVQGAQSGDLEVNKPVNLNGRPAGVLNVSIDQNSQLHLSSADLSQLLPNALYERLNVDGDYVAFDTLRTSGIDISYDPVRDTLAINL